MHRSHVYVVPEDEIEADVGIYYSYVRKYHKVEFVLSEGAYEEYKILYPDFKKTFVSGSKPEKEDVLKFFEKVHGAAREAVSNLYTFFMSAVILRYKLSYKQMPDKSVVLIVSDI